MNLILSFLHLIIQPRYSSITQARRSASSNIRSCKLFYFSYQMRPAACLEAQLSGNIQVSSCRMRPGQNSAYPIGRRLPLIAPQVA
ncbi:hypothetical protein BDW60DRAFT_189281 [Aspergillus nidulans var. acristatus]